MVGAKVERQAWCRWTIRCKTARSSRFITAKEGTTGPSRDWLKIVKTSEAKSKIRQWFKKEKREENIQRGREEVELGLRQALLQIEPADLQELLQAIAKRMGVTRISGALCLPSATAAFPAPVC